MMFGLQQKVKQQKSSNANSKTFYKPAAISCYCIFPFLYSKNAFYVLWSGLISRIIYVIILLSWIDAVDFS